MDALALAAEDGRGMTAISLGELSSKPNRGYPNGGNLLGQNPRSRFGEREPGELKHLSILRKRNRMRFPE